MNCTKCGGATGVLENRSSTTRIRRRRECGPCGARFSTVEVRLDDHSVEFGTCPDCGGATEVTDSRVSGASIRRRRECTACKTRFSTLEVVRPERVPKPAAIVRVRKKSLGTRYRKPRDIEPGCHMAYERWLPAEDAILTAQFTLVPDAEIAAKLRRSVPGVARRASILGLLRDPEVAARRRVQRGLPPTTVRYGFVGQRVVITADMGQVIARDYRRLGPRELAKQLGIPFGTVLSHAFRRRLTRPREVDPWSPLAGGELRERRVVAVDALEEPGRQ